MGLAGAIASDLHFGDIIDEGISRHYLGPGEKIVAQGPLLEKLEQSMAVPYRKGLIWTFDAIYRETKENFLHYQKQGVLGVEMETVALYAVAAFRKVPIVSGLVISDRYTLEGWVPGFYDPKVLSGQHRLFEAMLRI